MKPPNFSGDQLAYGHDANNTGKKLIFEFATGFTVTTSLKFDQANQLTNYLFITSNLGNHPSFIMQIWNIVMTQMKLKLENEMKSHWRRRQRKRKNRDYTTWKEELSKYYLLFIILTIPEMYKHTAAIEPDPLNSKSAVLALGRLQIPNGRLIFKDN